MPSATTSAVPLSGGIAAHSRLDSPNLTSSLPRKNTRREMRIPQFSVSQPFNSPKKEFLYQHLDLDLQHWNQALPIYAIDNLYLPTAPFLLPSTDLHRDLPSLLLGLMMCFQERISFGENRDTCRLASLLTQ